MRRGLVLLLVLLLAPAIPATSDAITVSIQGTPLDGTEVLADGLPRLRTVDGRSAFVIEGTFGNFEIETCDSCPGPARVFVDDGDSVDQLTLTDAKVSLLSAAELQLTIDFSSSGQDFAPLPGGDYESAVAMNGTFARPTRSGPVGDMIAMSGFADFTQINELGDPPPAPSLTQTVTNRLSSSFPQQETAVVSLNCEEGPCVRPLAGSMTLNFTDARDSVRLPGSLDVLAANQEGPEGKAAIEERLASLDSAIKSSSGTQPGSVLVFPKWIRGTVQPPPYEESLVLGNLASTLVEPRTTIHISVTCPPDETCSEGQRVKLLARWVCPGNQTISSKFICKGTDFELFTTVKGTLAFDPDSVGPLVLPANHPPIPAPACEKGYLIVWVVSPDDSSRPRAIKFDALIGHAVLRSDINSAAAYKAIPIQALESLPTGALTDVNGDGRLQFDGASEYKAVTGQVRASVAFERARVPGTALARIDTVLTLLTLDTLSNRPNLPTMVDLHFFNESEVLLSASHEFVCWSDVRLRAIDPNLNEFFGRRGLIESTEAEKVAIFGVDDVAGPVTLLGIIETIEKTPNGRPAREYSYSLFHDGRPVPTTFEPN